MGDEYDVKLCDERHKKVDQNIDDLWRHNGDMIKQINGKFNKIMYSIFLLLLSIIGSLITIIATRH